MKTALITAYAVNPFKGSEDGTGWNITKQLAKNYKTIIITRKNNRPEIERYIKENNDPIHQNMDFKYYDLPQWAMFWKKKIGSRGYVLYFYLWQLFMPLFILKNKLKFDLCHVLNFHSDSHPHFLWVFGKPTIWGPIGHHPKMKKEYLQLYEKKVLRTDRVYALVKWMMRNLDPFFYLAKWKTDQIIGINSSVATTLSVKKEKVAIIPAVATDLPKISKKKESKAFNVLSVGRFTPMKGFDITISSFASFVKSLPIAERHLATLTLVGAGEVEKQLREMIKTKQIENQVEIISWVERTAMKKMYNDADVFLFPSHEGAGMVVPEAMSYGLPILCFDNVGPGELTKDAGIKIKYTNYEDSIHQFTYQLKNLFYNKDKRERLAKKSKETYKTHYTWEKKGDQIKKIYQKMLIEDKTIAVFHPSAELYGADRILVNALNAIPSSINKRVYLFREGPLVSFIKKEVENVEVIIKKDLPVIYRKIFTPIGILKFIKEWVQFFFFLKKEHQQFQFQSAYVNTLSCSFLLPLLSLLKIKRFVHVHEIIDTPKLVGYTTAWVSYLFSNKVVCVSNAVLNGLKRYVKSIDKKGITIHNGINAIEVTPKAKEDFINFYLFGRIKPEKGQWFLIDALAKIPKEKLKGTKFTLMGGVIMGQENVLQQLEKEIANKGLSNYVEIKDFSPNIAEAMSQADVCLIPSLMKDPFPTTVLEAMSASKPVITTNHGGAKEAVLDQETGFLVTPYDVDGLANAIINLIDKKTELQQIGKKAKERFQGFFTTQHFNHNWIQFNLQHQLI